MEAVCSIGFALSAILLATELRETCIDFNEQISPLVTINCTICHGGVKKAGKPLSSAPRQQITYSSQ